MTKVNFIGKDGFRWWIGQIPPVETWAAQVSGEGWGDRYKVRILGYHPYSKTELPDEDLPWAGTILPSTAGTGGANFATSTKIRPGDVVIGFFLDGDDGQLPMILGAFGRNSEVPQDDPNTEYGFLPFTGYTEKIPVPESTSLESDESVGKGKDVQPTPTTVKDKKKVVASSTLGITEIPADTCEDNFMGGVSGALDNLMSKVGSGIDLMEDIASTTKKIQSLSNGAVSTMVGSLYTNMIPSLQGGLERVYDATLLATGSETLGILAQKSFAPGIKNMQDQMGCLPGKIINGLDGTIRGLLEETLMQVVNQGTCVTEQFLGSLLGGITDSISSSLESPLSDIQGILPTAFKIEDTLKSSVDMFKSAGGFFGCNQADDKCRGQVKKYTLGVGPNKSFDLMSSYGNILDNMNIGGGGGSGLTSPFQKPDCAEPSSCGPPKVEFFGGDGIGGLGKAILGGFVDNTEGLSDLTSSITRTASIIGVEITDPGSRYFSAPPVISFVDPCNMGYGAVGRAVVDYNTGSPTYGQIIAVDMVSVGENYPISSSIEDENAINSDEVPMGVIDTKINNTGSGYEPETTTASDGNIEYKLSIQNGRIIGATPINNVSVDSVPKITIKSSTGSGAFIRPIIGRLPLSPQGEIIQIIDCVT